MMVTCTNQSCRINYHGNYKFCTACGNPTPEYRIGGGQKEEVSGQPQEDNTMATSSVTSTPPASSQSTSQPPGKSPEKVLEDRILAAEERRDLLRRKKELVELQAELSKIEEESADLEDEFNMAMNAIETKRQLGAERRRAATNGRVSDSGGFDAGRAALRRRSLTLHMLQ